MVRHNIQELINQVHILTDERDELVDKNNLLNNQVNNLRKQKQELMQRQSTLDNEVIKVEAQLNLIKEVVFRNEPF